MGQVPTFDINFAVASSCIPLVNTSVEQYKELTNKLIRTIEKRKIVPLNTLKNAHYTLRNPLYITIEIDDGLVIASLDDI